MKLVRKRAEMVLKYVIGKEVLQIGCVGMGDNDTLGGEQFTHGYLSGYCKELVGLDINDEGVKILASKGYQVVSQSADEPFNLKRKFDVVLAEEVIEHLFDLRTFMTNVKKHLKKDGLFVVVTPNPQALEYLIHKTLTGDTWINPHHTHWQSVKTMKKVLDTFDMEIVEVNYSDSWGENFRGKMFQILFFWLPNRLARHTLYVAKFKKGD